MQKEPKSSIAMAGVVIAIALVISTSAEAEFKTAGQMAMQCKEVDRIGKAANWKQLSRNMADAHQCIGAFGAIMQMVQIRTSETDAPALRICLPKNATLGQLIRIFQNYMSRHPEEEHYSFAVPAVSSLWEHYLCSAN